MRNRSALQRHADATEDLPRPRALRRRRQIADERPAPAAGPGTAAITGCAIAQSARTKVRAVLHALPAGEQILRPLGHAVDTGLGQKACFHGQNGRFCSNLALSWPPATEVFDGACFGRVRILEGVR
jgi:hypothetical protein